MRLRWLPEAWEDIQRLFEFLVDESPLAAERVVGLIDGGANRLLELPEIGRPMDDGSQRREIYLPFGANAYVLRYRLDGNIVVVIRVWHSREERER